MKERPILFKGEMVRAILDGRKTQTRRIVDPQPPVSSINLAHGPIKSCWEFSVSGRDYRCPYGQPGDRLWVRETYRLIEFAPFQHDDVGESEFDYRATPRPEFSDCRLKWSPSIFMPRIASRIDLEVTGVRVEQLQRITYGDIRREGMRCTEHDFDSGFCVGPCDHLVADWIELWKSINGPGSWDENPWVWVVEFKRVEP